MANFEQSDEQRRAAYAAAGMTLPTPVPTGNKPVSTPSPTLPTGGNAGKTLPQQPKGNLVAFADALDKTVSLARDKRIQFEKEFLGSKVTPGMMSASNFADILKDIDVGGSRFAEQTADRAYDAAKTDMEAYSERSSKIKDMGFELMKEGVPSDQVSKFLDAAQGGDEMEAVKLYSLLLPESDKFTYSTDQIGDTLYQLKKDKKTGEVIEKKALLTIPGDSPTSSSSGGYRAGQLTELLKSKGISTDDATLKSLWFQAGNDDPYVNDTAHNSILYQKMTGGRTFDFVGGASPSVTIFATGKKIPLPPGTQEDDPIVMQTVQQNGGGNINTVKPTGTKDNPVDTSGEVSEWLLNFKNANDGEDPYKIWEAAAKELASTGLNPGNYDKQFWAILHPKGLEGYKKYVTDADSGDDEDGA